MLSRSIFGAALLALAATPVLAGSLGVWDLPTQSFGKPTEHFVKPLTITEQTIYMRPGTGVADLKAALATAQQTGTHLVLDIAPLPKAAMQRGSNVFSLPLWKAAMNYWCQMSTSGRPQCFDFSPYIKNGTLLALWVRETPTNATDPGLRDRSKPSLADIQQMAAYTKQLFPGVKVAVDMVLPCYLTTAGSRANIDIVMFEISTRDALTNVTGCNGTTYATGYQFVTAQTGMMRAAGLQYTLGMPVEFGGSKPAHASLASFKYYAELAAQDPNALGFLPWLYADPNQTTVSNGVGNWPNFWNEQANPGVTAAVQEVQTCFSGGACPSAPKS
ncbi:MAG TPA: hypothetical protein VGG48_15680 [Rhizomicrobium sp.]|jgi:hypothetical protein